MTDIVRLGPLAFTDDGSNGFIYTKLHGWISGAPMRAEVEDDPNGDGAFDVDRDYRGPRLITFEGGAVGNSLQDAEENFFDQIAALSPDGAPFRFAVEKPWGTRWAMVSIFDQVDLDDVGAGLVAAVNMQLIARDPIKYGPQRTLAPVTLPTAAGGLQYPLGTPDGTLTYGALGNLGRAVLTNAGTADTWPSFAVTGELSDGFYLQCLETGQVIRYPRQVAADQTITINANNGDVLIDGISDASTYLVNPDFFPVPRKGSCTVQFNAIGTHTGTPTMTATVTDGYW